MRNLLVMAGVSLVSAVSAVKMFEARGYSAVAGEAAAITTRAEADTGNVAAVSSTYYGDEVRIKASPDQQFYIDADVNRSRAKFLVDTGASYVALRESDARNAGIYTAYADFNYPVKTANGETKAALVTIDEIEIGGLRVSGVKAFVLQDEQLSINLLGMSFLSRLESVEARRGELVLRG